MLKPAIAGVTALALMTGGCVTTGTSTGTAALPISITQAEQDAIAFAEGTCAVAPTLEAVTQILVASSASATLSEGTAQAAATAFCKGVMGQAQTASGTATVGGKLVKFKFLPRKAPVPVANGVVDYGTITINGKVIRVQGVPQA